MRLLVPAAVAALIATTAMSPAALPVSALPVSALPVAALPVSALPVAALPVTALPVSALPVAALPVTALPASALQVAAPPASALPASALTVVPGPHAAPLGGVGADSQSVPAEPSARPSPSPAEPVRSSGLAPADPGLVFGARASAVSSGGPSGRSFTWPLAPRPAVHRRFEPPRDRYSRGHRGVDLLSDAGEPVLSAGEGMVAFSGVVAGRGVVTVRHSGTLRTSYEPVERRAPSGMRVHRGTPIGVVSPTPGHCTPLTCLHWGAVSGATYLDPLSLLGLGRPILLPLG